MILPQSLKNNNHISNLSLSSIYGTYLTFLVFQAVFEFKIIIYTEIPILNLKILVFTQIIDVWNSQGVDFHYRRTLSVGMA